MSKRIQQGFMKIMPTSLIAILVTGLFLFTAVQHFSVNSALAETAAGFTVNNNGTSTHKGGDSAVAMELVLPTPATDTAVAGLTVAGTTGLATFPAGWAMYGYSAGAGQFNAAADWIGLDNDGDGVYTFTADATVLDNADTPSAGQVLYDVTAADNVCSDNTDLVFATCVYTDSGGDCDGTDGDTHTYYYDNDGGADCATAADTLIVTGNNWATTDDNIDATTDFIKENVAEELTYSAAADTLIAGTAPAAGTALVNMNSAKPAGWTQLLIDDGGVGGTWEVGFDMIWNDVDTSGYYNADKLTSIKFGNPGTVQDSDIASFAVYEDSNANGIYDAGTDVQIASKAASPFIGQDMAATGSVYAASSGEKTIFFVVTFAANPTNGRTFTAKLPFISGGPYAAQFASGDDGPTDADVDTTDTITIDTVAPGFSAATSMTWDLNADGTIDKIRVDFNERVDFTDPGGAGDGVAGLTISNGCTTIANGNYFNLNAISVTLFVTGCTAGDTSITPTVTYSTAGNSIYDVAGNEMADAANVVLTDDAGPVILSREYLSSGNNGTVDRLYLTFSETPVWNGNDLTQFAIVNNDLTAYDSDGTPNALMGIGGVNMGLSTSGTTDLTGVSGGTEPTVQFTQSGTAGNRIKDGAGNDMPSEAGAVSISDDAEPVRTSFIAYEDIGGDGSVDQVSMYFTEPVTYTYQDSDWTAVANELTNFDVTGCADCTNVTTLKLTATADADMTGVTTTEPTLAYTAGNTIADANANTVANFGAVSMTDAAGPVIIDGTYQDNDGDGRIETILLEFTEDVVFSMNGANWSWGVAGDMTFTGDFNVAECTGTGTDTITCLDAGLGSFNADAGETGATTQPRWDYDGGGGISDGANGMGAVQITLIDGAAPAYNGAIAYSDTVVRLFMTEDVASVTYGAAGAWTATGLTVSNVTINGGNASILDLTVASLGSTAYTAADFAFTGGVSGSDIKDAGNWSTASFVGRSIADGQAPVLVGLTPVYAVTQAGAAPSSTTNLWYYYAGGNLKFKVEASEPLLQAKACVRSITSDNTGLTCGPGDFVGVEDTDYITSDSNVGNVYEFDSDIGGLAGGWPTTVGGYPMNIALVDTTGNVGYGAGGAEAFTAVFNVVPTAIDATLGGSTTDWSTITDFTAATSLVFEKTGGGILSFAGPLDLTATATVTALQALSTNVITAVDNPTGTAVLGIRSDNLAAFDTAATLTAHMPTAVRPGLVVRDNAGTIIGRVPNDQSGDIVIGGDTLGTFTWNAGAQTLSWTTTGFSSFGSDSTPPTVTAGNIQLTSTGSGIAGAYIIGDQVIVEWDNSAAGDNNGADFNNATADFTGFGNAVSEPMTDTGCGGAAGDDIYEACYTIVDGAIDVDGTNINAAVTAYDLVGNYASAVGTDNATVDNIAPTIGTPGSLTITTDGNSNSVANIGDTVTYNDGTPGDADGYSWVVNLTTLTGDNPADNAGSPYTVILGTLTGTQTFTETATDDAGNTVTGNTAGLAVDNRSLLTSTNVQPASLLQSTSNTVTVDFTTATALPANGKIKVTFGAGFDVTGAANGTCSTMDGTFVTTVAGQVVTITRQNDGAIEAPGAQTCTIDTIVNPAATGTTGVYTILTTTSVDAGIDIDDAVTADTITSSAPPTTQCSDGIDNDGNGLIDYPNDPYCTSAGDTLEAYEGGGGGGGGGGGASTNTTSNSTTTTAVAPITTLEGDQTYSSPVQFDQADITVDEDNGTSTAQLTNEGSLTMKPNSKSTVSAYFPPNTEVTGPANWNGRIDPPVVRSLTMITRSGEEIEGTNDKLMREDVAAIIKVGATVPLQFSQEVTLEIPVDLPNGSFVLLYTSKDGNTWDVSGEGVVQDGKLIVKTDHFSYFAVVPTDGMPETVAPEGFADIVGHWAESFINEIADLGIVSGKTATTYAPNDYITRAELTKIATKAFGVEIDPAPGFSPFVDVSLNDWFAPYVIAARNEGIVEGVGNEMFAPNASIDRAAALKIILESAGFSATEAEALFGDVPTDAWYAGYVTFANKNGVVSGKSATSFAPGDNITRAEVAKIVVKVMDLQEAE